MKTTDSLIKIMKVGTKCGVLGFGVQLISNNTLEMIHQFYYYARKSFDIYFDNPIVKRGFDFYKEILLRRA